ncbi:MAG: protein ligase [Bacteroidetes bacterium]|jgi:lipoate-protein ligase A|nr:protein ligase [Bacteroidota bacterium]
MASADGSWRERLSAYYPRWAVRVDADVQRPEKLNPQAQVAGDVALAHALLDAPEDVAPHAGLYRVWANTQCLVVTRREERLPSFAGAVHASAARGWPVVVRDSGGTTVPHLPGTLLLTLLLPRRRAADPPVPEPRADEVFTILCEPVIEAVAGLGVTATYGAVPRSFCDGRFNLVVHDRKIAGTAQRWRGGLPRYPVRDGFIMAHLALYVDADMQAATHAVNTFLADAGSAEAFDPEQMITLGDALRLNGADDAVPGLHETFREALVEVLRTPAR